MTRNLRAIYERGALRLKERGSPALLMTQAKAPVKFMWETVWSEAHAAISGPSR